MRPWEPLLKHDRIRLGADTLEMSPPNQWNRPIPEVVMMWDRPKQRASARGGVTVAVAAPLIAIILLVTGCSPGRTTAGSASPATARTLPIASPSPPLTTPSASTTVVIALGDKPVGDLQCGSDALVWTSSSHPTDKGLVSDEVWTSNRSGAGAKRLTSAIYGGMFGAVDYGGQWFVFDEYQQLGQSQTAAFWHVRAVNIVSDETILIASATSGRPLEELPLPTTDGKTIVWDELSTSGKKQLIALELDSRKRRVLSLPTNSYPISPRLRLGRLIYEDNSDDPGHAQEAWVSRRGSLHEVDMPTGRMTLISAELAQQPAFNGAIVAWHGTVPDTVNGSGSAFDVRLMDLATMGTAKVADFGARSIINDRFVAWYDYQAHNTHVLSLAGRHETTSSG